MTCRELIGFLCDYLFGRLDEHQARIFEAHLANCPSCVAFINDLGAIARLGRCARAGDEVPVPKEVPVPLIVAVQETRNSPSQH